MAQVLKPEVRDRIQAAALRCFAEHGYERTTLARIAAEAGTAVANLYRYFPSKQALLDVVVPCELPERHDALLDTRITALSCGTPAHAAEDLLDFWVDHRLAVAILLDNADGTPYADYPAAFVHRMVTRMHDHVATVVETPLSPAQRTVLYLLFDNTRRAIAQILRTANDRDELRALITAFWSYQVPGLDGFLAHLRDTAHP